MGVGEPRAEQMSMGMDGGSRCDCQNEWEKCLDEGFALEASMKDAHKSGANQASKGLMRETPNPSGYS